MDSSFNELILALAVVLSLHHLLLLLIKLSLLNLILLDPLDLDLEGPLNSVLEDEVLNAGAALSAIRNHCC